MTTDPRLLRRRARSRCSPVCRRGGRNRPQPSLSESGRHFIYARNVGDQQKLSADEQIRTAREAFESGEDLTVAVEEEFAAPRRGYPRAHEPLRGAQGGRRRTDLEEHVVGELIASEIEIKTGRCDGFRRGGRRMAERRDQLPELADRSASCSRAADASVEPLARPADHRQRRTTGGTTTSSSTSSGATTASDPRPYRIRGRTARSPSATRIRNVLPELLAPVGELALRRGLRVRAALPRGPRSSPDVPRCGVPDAFDGWKSYEEYVRFLYDTRSIDEYSQIGWSVRPHLAFRPSRCGSATRSPNLADAQARWLRFVYALGARFVRAVDDGERCARCPTG